MSRSKDPLALDPHWHVDYRIEAELPEDTVVGKRFLINVAFTVPALAAVVIAGWLWFFERNGSIDEIKEAEQYINKNQAGTWKIDKLQLDYDLESKKIDQVYDWVQPQIFVSGFVASLGRSRTRHEQISIDLIEWNDTGVFLRGNLRGRPEQATLTLRDYLADLNKDDQIKPLFETIKLTDVGRGSGGDSLRFEIKFILKARK